MLAPLLDFLEEFRVDLCRAAFAAGGLGVTVEGALEYRVLGEMPGDPLPFLLVFAERAVKHPSGGCLVGLFGPDAPVVHGELLEVGQDRQRQLAGPGVTAKLVRGLLIPAQPHGRLLGLHEELAGPADAKAVVGGFGGPADLDGVFVNDVLVGLGQALFVVHIPAERHEQRIDELVADLGFVVCR